VPLKNEFVAGDAELELVGGRGPVGAAARLVGADAVDEVGESGSLGGGRH
jgi:hypothetical protein